MRGCAGALPLRGPIRGAGHRRFPLVVIGLATALSLPSLWSGLHLDDYVHLAIAAGLPIARELYPSRLDLFTFLDGDPERTSRMIDLGIVPWWTAEDVRISFWRPLPALTHWIDYNLWPDRPILMHAQNLAWAALLIATVWLLYRRIIGLPWIAGIAALLYGLDGTHAVGVGWLANRNVLMAAVFGTLAVWAHDRWRRDGWRPGVVLGPGLFALGLLSAEAAIATGAYVVAHAWVLDPAAPHRRAASLLPYVGVVAAWQAAYRQLGHGIAAAAPAYVDPLVEPIRFSLSLLERAPVLLAAGWFGLSADRYAELGPAAGVRWYVATAGMSVLAAVLTPLVRRDRVARFWGVGQLLALIPLGTPSLSDRHLFFVGIGAMGLLATYLCGLLGRDPTLPRSRAWLVPAVVLGGFLAAHHLVISPAQLLRGSGRIAALGGVVTRAADRLPVTAHGPATVVIVKAPSAAFVGYTLFTRLARREPIPDFTRMLTATHGAVEIERLDRHRVVVRPRGAQDLLFRPAGDPMRVGHRVELTGVSFEVAAVNPSGSPGEILVRFDVDVDDPRLHWGVWRAADPAGYAPMTPPAIGETILIE